MLIRSLGVAGMADRIREHCRLAGALAAWVDADPDWERLADVPFGLVCLRFRPRALAGRADEPAVCAQLDACNERILEHVNRSGRIFLSHTRLHGRYAIRVAVGNPRATEVHLRRCWDLLREGAGRAAADWA
jgi:aromatic-L-amino-acid decarboxylase